MLHYEDATLKDLYFLDPQWLCDMLAHVVTIREINPFAPNGKPVNLYFIAICCVIVTQSVGSLAEVDSKRMNE